MSRIIRKRVLALCLVFAAVTALFVGCAKKTEAEKTIIVGFSNSIKVSFLDDDNTPTGYEIDVLQEVDKRLADYKFEYQVMDFASLFTALEANKVDIIMGCMRRSEAREEKYLYTSEPHNFYPYRLIVLQDNDTINSLEDLKGKKIALGPGALQTTIVENWNAANGGEIEIVYNSADAIADLQAGRVDATVLGDLWVDVYNEASNAGIKAVGAIVKNVDGVASDSTAYYILRKDEKDFRDLVSQTIKDMRADGALSKLSIEWFGKDNTLEIDENRTAATN
ncbi:MAG: transporter substrate-binding domain-containing protein [Oscillospiraceae bacterium]|jgi:L-cystine transport system substrate-binding protein|nr:transporter substrate-binding domain-containing protein [Oscillospiraceae bacterium]